MGHYVAVRQKNGTVRLEPARVGFVPYSPKNPYAALSGGSQPLIRSVPTPTIRRNELNRLVDNASKLVALDFESN
jgi:hypothetical protein